MLIIGCDFHPGFQQVAIFDNTSGEIQERRLGHRDEATRARASQVVASVLDAMATAKEIRQRTKT